MTLTYRMRNGRSVLADLKRLRNETDEGILYPKRAGSQMAVYAAVSDKIDEHGYLMRTPIHVFITGRKLMIQGIEKRNPQGNIEKALIKALGVRA